MAWLGGWLREIVIIVLLAAFVDLLLPSRSMERYVRLVLSLLILLTLLSPVVSLLKGDAAAELSAAIGLGGPEKTADEELAKIMAEGQRIEASRQAESLELVAMEAAKQMKAQIRTETGEEPADVEVKLKAEPESGGRGGIVPVIEAVHVMFRDNPAKPGGGPDDAPETGQPGIRPVEPVVIEVGGAPDGEGGADDRALPASAEAAEQDAASASRRTAIVKTLEAAWGLTDEQIQVSDGTPKTFGEE